MYELGSARIVHATTPLLLSHKPCFPRCCQETEKNNNETITSLEKEKSELEQKLSDVTAEKDTLQNSCDTLLEENGKLKQECT